MMEKQPTFDMSQLTKLVGADTKLQRDLLSMFLFNIDECYMAVSRHSNDNDNDDYNAEVWRSAMSEVEALSKTVGAIQLSEIAGIAKGITFENESEQHKWLCVFEKNISLLQSQVKNW